MGRLLILALVMAGAGCGPGGDSDRLHMLVPATEIPFWRSVATSFADRTGIGVDLVEGPNSTDTREAMTTAALLARDPSLDLVYMDVTWTSKLAGAGFLVALDGEIPAPEIAALLPSAVEAGRLHGRLYRVPVRTDVGVLYYRRDWLEREKIPVPSTFAELRLAAATLQSPPGIWGFVWPGTQYEGLVCTFLEVLAGFGGFWIDPATREVGLDRPPAVAALRFLGEARGSISPPGVTTYREEESRRLFQDGRAAFLRNWPYVYRLSQAAGSPLAGRVGVRSMVRDPGGRSAGTLGGWGLGVSRYSARRADAVAFVRHAIRLDSQRLLCAPSGYAPARIDAYEDPALLAANPFLRDLREIHAVAVSRPAVARYAQVSDVLQRHLSAGLSGVVPPEEALARAAAETRIVLEGQP